MDFACDLLTSWAHASNDADASAVGRCWNPTVCREQGLFHTLQDLQAWDVSLVAQTGLQFDLHSAQGKLIASLMAAWRSSNGIYCVSECARASRPRASAASCSADGPVSASRRTV